MRKPLSILMLVAAVALLIVAAVRWRGSATHIAAMASQKNGLAAELDTTRAALYQASLRYQGFLKGRANIPDSLRAAEAGRSVEIGKTHRKTILALENSENRIVRQIGKLGDGIETARREQRRSTLPLLGGALVLGAAGAFLLALARARRVAP